jgi:hypothetical protein
MAMSNPAPKRPKPKSPSKNEPKTPPPMPKQESIGGHSRFFWTVIWTVVSALVSGTISVVGLLVAVLTLLPRVNVIISDPVDPNYPFSSSVTVINDGYIPLNIVSPKFALKKIEQTTGQPIFGDPDYGSDLVPALWHARNLGPDNKFAIALNDVTEFSTLELKAADIAIVVDYQLPIVHIKRRAIFPFYAKRQTNGNFYWYPDAPPEN